MNTQCVLASPHSHSTLKAVQVVAIVVTTTSIDRSVGLETYTQGAVTSQRLWPRYDRHVVGITRHIMCPVNGRRFIVLSKQHSIRWFMKMSVSLPTELISVISQWKTFIRVLPTRRRRKPAGIEITSPSPCVHCQLHDARPHHVLTRPIARSKYGSSTRSTVRPFRFKYVLTPSNCRTKICELGRRSVT